MSPPTHAGRTLRDRKRDRTRRALIAAAVDLFERRGYDGTTVADIAAAADVGTRTFFSYFGSKEELMFPDSQARVRAAVAAIAARRPSDRPADVLLRALRDVGATDGGLDDMVGRLTALRLRLIRTVPAVRGRALQLALAVQREIAGHLRRAFPAELDDVGAAALVGAFVGAVTGALQVLLEDPDTHNDPEYLRQRLHTAMDDVLRPWR
ncbi:MAG: TetR family transcriptional regulator [Kutzneria sp.]|nr:TetR family transcriptional regulator [Kutzneria sp.]